MSQTATRPAPAQATDPRTEAFCRPGGPDVFGGVVYHSHVWLPDEFDVESIHAEARRSFDRMLARATAPDRPPHGRVLLLLGQAGSGKTHLLRAFRAAAHDDGRGYCGYLQMTTRTDSYDRYLLANLIDSLERPYRPGDPETGLRRLARGVLDALVDFPDEDRRLLAEDPGQSPDETARLVHRMAFAAVQYPKFHGIDLDLIRAVLFVLANDLRMHAVALKWLRCEDLGRYDRELLGDLVPRPQPDMAVRTARDLGRLMHAVHNAAFVLLVDQLEETIDLDAHPESRGKEFREAIRAVVDLVEDVPNAAVVIGCLEDLFDQGKTFLSGPKLDRLRQDPPPVHLAAGRTAGEVQALVGRRLEVFFETLGIPADPANPLAPYTAVDLSALASLPTRKVLGMCFDHRRACFAAGRWVPPVFEPGPGPGPVSTVTWEQRWNDYRSTYKAAVLGDEPNLASLLASTIRAVSDEMPDGTHFGTDPHGRFVPVEVHRGNAVDKLYVAVCDRSTRGGGLNNQIREVASKVGEIPAVLVRSTPFPNTPGQQAVQEMVKLIAPRGKGRKVVVSDSDWRAMAAFREFHARHGGEPGFADWRRADRPLSELPAVHAALALDRLLAAPPAPPQPPAVPPTPTGLPKPPPSTPPVVPPPPVAANTPVRLGFTRGSLPELVTFRPADLCKHAAFLGGSGSGKTTAALVVIEQLLLAGVPAVLLDRKGDLARYADPDAWTAPEPDPERAARRARLRAAVDVALYTPGAADGRPLAIPVVPPDLASLPAAEREQLARYAAASLGQMMGHRGRGPDPKQVILAKAIDLLAAVPGRPVTAAGLQQLVKDRDEGLTAAFEGYDDRHYRKLAEDLLTLAHQHRRLLEGGDPLDVDALLGRGPAAVPGRTRLAVVNTQFLGDDATTDFWVAQFLLAVDRWRARSPAADGALQAVFLFDEAEKYLPAVGKPATKGPMESLLRRARSAGVGIFLASQSPGDFDYRCRDQVTNWLVGKVKEPVAQNKLKPMLSARPDAVGKLAGQPAGEFFLVRDSNVTAVKTDRNLIPTEQLPDHRTLTLARAGVRAGTPPR